MHNPLLKEPMPIQSKDNLELDLGLDSLQRIELVVSLENKFSIKLPETFASDIQTVGEIVEKMKGLGHQQSAISSQLSASRKRAFSYLLTGAGGKRKKKKVGLKQGAIEWFFVSLLMGDYQNVLQNIFQA